MKVIYTAITGNYDSLTVPVISEGWKYICYTTEDIKSDVWEIVKVPKEKDSVKQARRIKIVPPFKCECCLW